MTNPPPRDATDEVAAAEVAAAEDEAARVRLASNPQTVPEVLRALAADGRVTIRAAVALNPAAPEAAERLLAADPDERVRQVLGRKFAELIPGLSREGRAGLPAHVMETLRRLVEDETERVRRTIADLVRDVPDAPRELILRLARDAAIPVSGPVLRLSPVLTPADMLTLLASPATPATATAIAGRENLDGDVADAIAAGADNAAIEALLANPSAQLREAALDALVGRAAAQESWHDPLVRRPALSGGAATALAAFVATHLLAVLADRTDLAPAITGQLRARLAERTSDQARARAGTDPSLDEAMRKAHVLHADGRLDEAAIRAAAQRGEPRTCMAMLAVAARLPASAVERVANTRNAKALVSLVWSAGFSMDIAVGLQTLVGRVAPGAVLRGPDDASFPLAADEMRWQIDLLKRMSR